MIVIGTLRLVRVLESLRALICFGTKLNLRFNFQRASLVSVFSHLSRVSFNLIQIRKSYIGGAPMRLQLTSRLLFYYLIKFYIGVRSEISTVILLQFWLHGHGTVSPLALQPRTPRRLSTLFQPRCCHILCISGFALSILLTTLKVCSFQRSHGRERRRSRAVHRISCPDS